jgi:hypothetical protein
MTVPLTRPSGALLAVWALLLVGCSRDPLDRQAVSGTVHYRGEPLALGQIEFSPADGQGTFESARVEAGRFAIPRRKGLSPGNYTVRVNAPKPVGPPVLKDGLEVGPPPENLIPPRYNEKTTLRATVEKGGANNFPFDLK